MKVFIVHAHPEPQSFNTALTRHAHDVLTAAGHEVRISDLYEMQFDPVSDRHNFLTRKDPDYFKQQVEEMYATEMDSFAADIKAEIEKLEWCDVLIFHFPLWWFGLPAILKGWVDRVFVMGRIYGGGKWYDNGVFRGKRAMLSLTTGGSEAMYSPTGLNGDIQQILFPINHGVFHFVGFDVLSPFIAWSVSRIGDEGRKKLLEDYKQRLLSLPELPTLSYPSLIDYDDNFQLKQH